MLPQGDCTDLQQDCWQFVSVFMISCKLRGRVRLSSEIFIRSASVRANLKHRSRSMEDPCCYCNSFCRFCRHKMNAWGSRLMFFAISVVLLELPAVNPQWRWGEQLELVQRQRLIATSNQKSPILRSLFVDQSCSYNRAVLRVLRSLLRVQGRWKVADPHVCSMTAANLAKRSKADLPKQQNKAAVERLKPLDTFLTSFDSFSTLSMIPIQWNFSQFIDWRKPGLEVKRRSTRSSKTLRSAFTENSAFSMEIAAMTSAWKREHSSWGHGNPCLEFRVPSLAWSKMWKKV